MIAQVIAIALFKSGSKTALGLALDPTDKYPSQTVNTIIKIGNPTYKTLKKLLEIAEINIYLEAIVAAEYKKVK